jgi:hypothetical protein
MMRTDTSTIPDTSPMLAFRNLFLALSNHLAIPLGAVARPS